MSTVNTPAGTMEDVPIGEPLRPFSFEPPVAYQVGDTVSVVNQGRGPNKWPGNWTVDRVNGQSYSLLQGTRRLRADKFLVAPPVSDAEHQAAIARQQSAGGATLFKGAIVRSTRRLRAHIPLTELFVVTDLKLATGTATIAMLGGSEEGKFVGFVRVPVASLALVPKGEVIKA